MAEEAPPVGEALAHPIVVPEPVPVVESPSIPPAAVIALSGPMKPQNGHARGVERRRDQKAAQLRLF